MKFLLGIFITLIVNSPSYAFKVPAVGSGALAKDLQDFVDLIPFPDLVNLTKTYTAQDKEFKATMNLMKSVELKEWLQFVESNPEFTVLMNFMWHNGLNSYNLVNQLNEKVGIPRIPFIFIKFFSNISNLKITGGIDGFIKDTKSIVPIESLKKLYNDKLKTSQVWKSVVDEVTSDKYHGYYHYIFNNFYYQNLEQNAINAGLNKNSFRTYLPILIIYTSILLYFKPMNKMIFIKELNIFILHLKYDLDFSSHFFY